MNELPRSDRRRRSRLAAPLAGLLCLSALVPARGVDLSAVALDTVVSGLAAPVAVTHAGDDRLFVTLQDGRIVIVEDGAVRSQPFLDIRDRVASGGERGLLSVAFHPAYATTGTFFVDYTNLAGDTVIARYAVTADPDLADPASERILLTIDQPQPNHNGGQLHFGPDGDLYVGMGDGGGGNDPQCNAQNGATLLGKLLRLDVDASPDAAPYFGIPPDNPFVGDPAVRDEVWATGLRNPWRFSFDRSRGDLYIADVGQGIREEVDFQPAGDGGGENYGWKVMEGTFCLGDTDGCNAPVPGCNAPAYTAPFLEYDHDAGRCAIIGGYVYRGARLPELAGTYLYGDLCTGTLWAAEGSGASRVPQALTPTAPGITSFGEGADGELYLTARDTLYRLSGPGPPPEAGRLQVVQPRLEAAEGAGSVTVEVVRVGGTDGAVSVDVATADGSAVAGADYQGAAATLMWEEGDAAPRSFPVTILDDTLVEGEESFHVALSHPTGGASLGTPSASEVVILDDEATAECVPDATTLCLNQGRFRVAVAFHDYEGGSGAGQAVPLSADGGYFWFFDADNPELFVKVLDACAPPFEHFWVFAAGLTDVQTTLLVADTVSGQVRRYDKPLGVGFDPIRDTSAFATCP